MIRAVVDVGSNSLILLVARLELGVWTPIHEVTRITGLGSGLRATGVLGEQSMADSLAALAEFREIAASLSAGVMHAGGTMAVRSAANQAEFLTRAAAQGTPITVISGDEEAALGFDAVANDPAFASHARLSIIDPGGNSTELCTADRRGSSWDVRLRRSYPVGALALRDGVLANESPNSFALLEAAAEIDDLVGLGYRPGESGTAIVLGATGTNLVSIRDQMATWQPDRVHGAVLTYEEVSKFVSSLSQLDDAGRRAVVGIQPGRERTIHVGALILERFLFALRAEEVSVSVRGWRHAWLESFES